MTVTLALVLTAGVCFASGVILLMERTLTRIIVGTLLIGNAVNLVLLIASGAPGRAPIVDSGEPDTVDPSPMSDPLPQALALTAIVITLGVAAFLLAMAYRSAQVQGDDEVADDIEDRRIMKLADSDEASDSYEAATTDLPDEEGADR